jgi:5-methylcytosine-specific restriction endonuclease McrA
VLVLNRLWQAVNVCSAERAFALLCTDHAQVVFEDENGFNTFSFEDWCGYSIDHPEESMVRTISSSIRMPRVILLSVFDRLPKKEVKFTRDHVFERDGGACQYCAQTFEKKILTLDHVIPRERGGITSWTNVVTCCLRCNQRKANRTPEEAGMRLPREPRKPHWRPFVEGSHVKRAHISWTHFLNPNHWTADVGEA